MKVMVVGSGGREHALAWKISASPRVTEVLAVPGNAGMLDVARTIPVALDPRSLLELARREAVDLTVVGPELPLVAGVADLFAEAGLSLFGPRRSGARLEGSKRFAKEFMRRHGVPTADFVAFSHEAEALAAVRRHGAPLVVKDSRLAAGKGVTVADTPEQAEEAVRKIFAAGADPEVVLEERLQGQEVSLLVFTDGRTAKPMLLAQDYKQAEDGDRGPMTGGMGTVAPVRLLGVGEQKAIEDEIVGRTLAGLRTEGIEYRGVLYFGVMLTGDGPRLLEYNVRFGDPETQVVLPLLESDLVEVMEATLEGRLGEIELRWSEAAAACVVMAAPGYPGAYRTGVPIELFDAEADLRVFHAGTAIEEGRLVSAGGRVLNVTATAPTVEEAVRAAYRGVSRVRFPGAHYRLDIGSRLRDEGSF